jgi:hypothetical protein
VCTENPCGAAQLCCMTDSHCLPFQDWSVRTENPWEANMFYVPALTFFYSGGWLHRWEGAQVSPTTERLQMADMCDWARVHAPAWLGSCTCLH